MCVFNGNAIAGFLRARNITLTTATHEAVPVSLTYSFKGVFYVVDDCSNTSDSVVAGVVDGLHGGGLSSHPSGGCPYRGGIRIRAAAAQVENG